MPFPNTPLRLDGVSGTGEFAFFFFFPLPIKRPVGRFGSNKWGTGAQKSNMAWRQNGRGPVGEPRKGGLVEAEAVPDDYLQVYTEREFYQSPDPDIEGPERGKNLSDFGHGTGTSNQASGNFCPVVGEW